MPALKLAVLAAAGGHLDYCDPDSFPVAHGSPLENAQARLPLIKANRQTFLAILSYLHLAETTPFTPADLIAISDAYKQIQAIRLQPSGGTFQFSVLVPAPGSPTGNELVSGTVSADGELEGVHRGPGRRIACPICLARGTLIDTPSGPVPVRDIRVGMQVWSTNLQGRLIRATVLKVGSMQAPPGHEVIRLRFADGRMVLVSPGHRVADGRMVGQLEPGDVVDGALVVEASPIPYSGRTYDLLPSGPTGTYFAGGILLDSTLSAVASH